MRLITLVLAIFAALTLPPAADARSPGWYFGLEAGWATLGSVDSVLPPSPGPQQGKAGFGSPSSASPIPPQLSSLTRIFAVFFELDSSRLDDKAIETIALATETARQGDIVRIQIIGRADAQEPVLHNLDLSENRAEAVKAQLMNDGVPERDIAITGCGFEDPLMPADPVVEEAHNRRAVIDMGS